MPRSHGAVATLVQYDCRVFATVARAEAPLLDRAPSPLSRAANHSVLWITIAGGLWGSGGRRGQRAAVRGLASIAVTSLAVNQDLKRLVRRPRPSVRKVPTVRRVKVVALTTSFASGHAASAAAFASGVACELAPAGLPLTVLAAAVGVSRVYVGVHYPLDVLVGGTIGAGVGPLSRRVWPVLPERTSDVPPSRDRRWVDPNPDGRGVAVVVNSSSGSKVDVQFVDRLRSRLPRGAHRRARRERVMPSLVDAMNRDAELARTGRCSSAASSAATCVSTWMSNSRSTSSPDRSSIGS